MPLMYVNYPEGTFTQDAIDKLAMQFTEFGREAEKIPKTPYLFSTTFVYFRPYPKELVFHGGKSGGTNVISLEVNAFEGGLDAAAKKDLIKNVTDAIGEATGLSEDQRRPVYVLVRDVPDINWGFFGKTIALNDLLTASTDEKPV